MKRQHREALALAAIHQVANLVEGWPDLLEEGVLDPVLEDLDPAEAAQQLGKWMARLPGRLWDDRLPLPE
ncbi:hypothetical protein IU485_27850 [Nocardia cyriacigeorgica]|uniref:hypothetical protein n=1 Tax=Nocardia cyriacigeorgica TaxID=135487 RepID=UPI0018951B57|nr:hypothetical protein [Nocardia cyriacigeorgica]MBF6085192.1 hypothetical protein [Nocardia cyriacigeorgica]